MVTVSEEGIRRLEREIRTKRNAILDALERRDQHPSTIKVTQVRYNLWILYGMVYSYLYITGRYTDPQPITANDEVNDLAMLWLSVDLIKMRKQAYGNVKEDLHE